MTDAAAILARAGAAGVRVRVAGDRLHLAAAMPPDPALLHALAGVKAELVDLLTDRACEADGPRLPPPGTPERAALDRAQARMVAGLLACARWPCTPIPVPARAAVTTKGAGR